MKETGPCPRQLWIVQGAAVVNRLRAWYCLCLSSSTVMEVRRGDCSLAGWWRRAKMALINQGVGTLIPLGQAAMLTPLLLSESWGDPPTAHKALLSSPRSWRHGCLQALCSPTHRGAYTHTDTYTHIYIHTQTFALSLTHTHAHTPNQLQLCVFNPKTQRFNKLCLFLFFLLSQVFRFCL
jgi:hypothetical protein